MTQRPGDRADHADARDRGLRRVRIATGWTLATCAVFSAVLATGYAAAAPGKAAPSPASVPAPPTGPTTPGSAPAPATGGSDTPGAPIPTPPAPAATTLRPPGQAPAPAPVQSPPHVVSGSS